MSLLIAIHAIDHIFLCGDHRAVSVRADGSWVSSDGDSKILQWDRGAIAGNGERWLTNAVMHEFCEPCGGLGNIGELVLAKTQQRIAHGVPFHIIGTSAWFWSEFKNKTLELCSIYFNDRQLVMENIGPRQIEAFGSHALPARIDRLRKIQKNIQPASDFAHAVDFTAHYVEMLAEFYQQESRADATVSPSFDICVQSCLTGNRAVVQHKNH